MPDAVQNIQLPASVRPEDVVLTRALGTLGISSLDGQELVRIDDFFSLTPVDSPDISLESGLLGAAAAPIEFADGTVWSVETVSQKVLLAQSLSSPQQLWGYASNDLLMGGSGQDSLYGLRGNDSLAGGGGDDELRGGEGSDTYLFSRGSGRDVIDDVAGTLDVVQLGDLNSTSVTSVARAAPGVNYDLVLSFDSGDQLVLRSYLSPRTGVLIEEIRFADGVTWELADIQPQLLTLGTDASEDLNGLQFAVAVNRIDGQGGNDTLQGGAMSDTLSGGAGNDRINGSFGADLLEGGEGHDSLFGDAGRDTLIGGDGNDSLGYLGYGSSRDTDADLLLGGAGQDTLIGGHDGDTLDGGAGDDWIIMDYLGTAGVVSVTLGMGSGHDVVALNPSAQPLRPHLVFSDDLTSDDLTFSQRWPAVGAGGYVISWGDDGTDSVRLTDLPDSAVTLGFADGSTLSYEQIKERFFTPTSGDDTFQGLFGNDTLLGGDGDDVLFAREGSDLLDGGSGSDELYAGSSGVHTLLGGDGGDYLFGFARGDWAYATGGASILDGQAGDDHLYAGNRGGQLLGGDGNDALYGLGAASGYYGRAASGASTLWGGAGNDTLFADVASDVLIGGAGSDTYSLMTNVSVGTVREFRIDPGTDGGSLADVEQVNMISWVGADVWDVRRLGNDLVLVARTGQSAVVRVVNNFVINPLTGQEEGLIDRIQMNSGAAVWDAAEILRRTTLDNTIPTDGADVLTGTAFDDLFQGSPGDDSLVGWGGADTLIGGEGADTMRGGRGNDVYFVDSSLDRVHEYKMTDSYGNLVSEGVDEVHTNLSEYTLPDNVENLVMGGKLGSAPDQRGVMTGKAGVRHGIGNGYDNLMTGGPGDEWFEGAGGLDRLLGGAGNDTLEGGSGRDTLEGGLGDDVYFLRQRFYGDSDIDDKIIERSDEGIDTVDTDLAAYTAAANIEQVFTTGASVTGNELNNVLRGGGTATVLSGMSGHDTLEGGGGGDTYRGGLGNDLLLAADVTSNDTFIWGIGDGADTIVDAGGGADQLNITGGSLPEQLWFSRSGDDLLVSIIGTTDSVTVSRWFVDDGAHRIERMTLADGQDILAAGVESLVNEMAAFAPPLEGQMSLPADVRASLSGVITTAWAG